MKFSIVVPVYNTEKYLKECLESILGQSYSDFEVIAIDDGSTDRSRDILRQIAKQHSNFKFISQSNKGPNVARMKGVSLAKGDYIWFVDSDDIISKDSLEIISTYIGKYGCKILKFRYTTFPVQVVSPVIFDDYVKEYYTDNDEIRKMLVTSHILNNLATEVISKDLLDKEMSWGDMIQGEDLFINMQLYDRREKIVFVQDVLYYYRKNPTSTSNCMDIDIIRRTLHDKLEFNEHLISYSKKWDIYDKDTEKKIRLNFLEFLTSRLIKSSKCGESEIAKLLDDVYKDKSISNIISVIEIKDIIENNLIRKIIKIQIIKKNKKLLKFMLICVEKLNKLKIKFKK